MSKSWTKLPAGLAIIYASWAVGTVLVAHLHIPLPGAVMGIAVMVAGFTCIPGLASIVAPAGRQLLRLFPLFLYPLGAGFLTLSSLPFATFIKIAIAILASLVASMSLCAIAFRYLRHVRS